MTRNWLAKLFHQELPEFNSMIGVASTILKKSLWRSLIVLLDVRLLLSSPQMMDDRDGYFSQDLYDALRAEYDTEMRKCADRIQLSTGVNITTDTLKRELDDGRQLIVQCIVPGDADGLHDHALHWVVVYAYEGDSFFACDPLSSKIRLTAQALEGYMDTPIGHICVAVGGKP